MAHMIENNEMAYVGEKPWHDEGNQLTADRMSAIADDLRKELGREPNQTDVWLRAAKLGWLIEQRDVFVALGDTTKSMYRFGNVAAPQYKAIVRADNNTVFSIPSKRYQIVQNAEVIDLFREYCEAGHATMETVGAIRGGAVVWALAKLNGGSSLTLKGNDVVNGYVLFTTSHDGSMPTMGKATQVRVVCHNTLSMAVAGKNGKLEGQFKMKHSAKWTSTRQAQAKEQMEIALKTSAKFNDACQKLSSVNIDQAGRLEFVNRLLKGESLLEQVLETSQPVNMLDAAIAETVTRESAEDNMSRVGKAILEAMLVSPGSDLESAKNTLWGAVNGVTHYVDHERGRTADARLSQGWYGVGDALKTDAMQIALEMAGHTL